MYFSATNQVSEWVCNNADAILSL